MNKRQAVVEVKDVSIGFSSKVIQRHLDFEVYEGEIFVILGGSGCGKSTLLKSIIGLYQPLYGDISLQGMSIKNSQNDIQAYRNILKEIGVMYQGGALLGSLTLAENIALPLHEHTNLNTEEIASLVSVKLALVNLHGFELAMPSELSGGMRKRAAIARALALNPGLLFLDEPSAGLDPILSSELDHLLIKINKNLATTMIIVSHELASIKAIAERVIVLDQDGQGIIEQGPPGHLAEYSKVPYVRHFFHRQPHFSFEA